MVHSPLGTDAHPTILWRRTSSFILSAGFGSLMSVDDQVQVTTGEKAPGPSAKLHALLQTTVLALLVAVLSYFAAHLGGTIVLPHQEISVLWPACALLVSVLLLAPLRTWPVLIPAGLAGFVLHDLQFGFTPRAIALLIVADTIEILIAALGVRYSFDGVPRLNSMKALGKYCFFAVFLAPFISTFVGASGTRGTYWANWRIDFCSEALAFLTLTPAILSWVDARTLWTRTSRRSPLEAAALIGTLVFSGYFVLLGDWSSIPFASIYAFLPFLLWAALRFGSMGVSTSIIVISFLAIWGAIHGRGPFAGPETIRNVLSLQLFLLFAAAPFMLLAVLVEERERAQEFLSSINRRLIEAHEQERTRIARELHDDICQRLALFVIRIENVAAVVNGNVGAGDQLEQMRQECLALSDGVQALSRELHPSVLEHLGLVAAVRSFCREVSARSGVVVEFTDRNISHSLPWEVSLSLFRVIQEAVHNSVKYSGEKRCQVHLYGVPAGIELEVSDQGTGFDPERAKNTEGLGLVSMRERIQLLNGTFYVESKPNAGTRISARVPLGTRERALRD